MSSCVSTLGNDNSDPNAVCALNTAEHFTNTNTNTTSPFPLVPSTVRQQPRK